MRATAFSFGDQSRRLEIRLDLDIGSFARARARMFVGRLPGVARSFRKEPRLYALTPVPNTSGCRIHAGVAVRSRKKKKTRQVGPTEYAVALLSRVTRDGKRQAVTRKATENSSSYTVTKREIRTGLSTFSLSTRVEFDLVARAIECRFRSVVACDRFSPASSIPRFNLNAYRMRMITRQRPTFLLVSPRFEDHQPQKLGRCYAFINARSQRVHR